MLDAIKGFTGGTAVVQRHADDLHTLIASAQQERAALSAILTQVTMRGSKLSQMSRALETFEARSAGTLGTLDEIDQRVAAIEQQCVRLTDLDQRVAVLLDAAARARQTAEDLIAPGSTVHLHRDQVQELFAQLTDMQRAVETIRAERAAVDGTLQRDRAAVEALQTQLGRSTYEIKQSLEEAAGVRGVVEEVRGVARELKDDYARLTDDTRGIQENSASAIAAVQHVEATVGQLTAPGSDLRRCQEQIQTLSGHLGEMRHAVEDMRAQQAAIDETLQGTAAERVAEIVQQLTAPGSDIHRCWQQVHELSERLGTMKHAVESLQREGATVEDVRAQLAQSTSDLTQALEEAAAVRTEVDRVRGTADELAGRFATLTADATGLREQTAAAIAAVSRVESTAASLAQVRDLATHTEDRVSALNALAEHVMQKTQSLDGQKHVVERAVVEANRLNEMVWNMDVQIDKLNDGLKQITRGEQAAARIRQVVDEAQARADAAAQGRDEFIRETGRFEREGRALMSILAGSVEKLALHKNDFDAFDRRLNAIQTAIGDAEKSMVSVAAREKDLGAMDRRIETLSLELRLLTTQAAEIGSKQATLDALHARLREVDDLSRRTTSQYNELQKSRFDLDALRSEAEDVRRIHGEIAQMRDRAAQDRSALEAFAGRLAAFRAQIPELDATTSGILGKMGQIDEGFRKAVKVEEIAAGLDAQLAILGTRVKAVDRIEGRLDALHTLTDDVDRKLSDQLARRSELDTLKARCDAVAAQVLDAQQKVEAVDALRSKLAGLSDRVAHTQEQLERVQDQFAGVKADEVTITEQQGRLSVLVDQSRTLMAEVADRMTQVRTCGSELAASATLKQQLAADLVRLETRQREVARQSEAVEEQLRKTETAARLLDQHQSQFAASERKLAEVEERVAGTIQKAGELDRRMKQLLDRDDALASIKADLTDLHRMTEANKADLHFLLEHRQDIAALRPQMEALLANAADVQARITEIESRRKAVEEVQARTYTVMTLFEDVRLNLETMGAHKAIIDDVQKKISGLGFAVQEADNMLRALKNERQLAQQVEESIKELR